MVSLSQTGHSKKSRRQGTVKQRHKGSWEVRYYSPADQNGKQKRISETIKGTKKEAEKLLRNRLSAIENGTHVDKSKQTVSEFLDQWFDTYVATNCTLRTASGYRGNKSPGMGYGLGPDMPEQILELCGEKLGKCVQI